MCHHSLPFSLLGFYSSIYFFGGAFILESPGFSFSLSPVGRGVGL